MSTQRGSNARRQRAASIDHLGALAAPFHPHAVPLYDWERQVWYWVPPWQDPKTTSEEAEVLGHDWQEAAQRLFRLQTKLPCQHGVPIVRSCPDCRAHVVEHLAEHVRQEQPAA